MKRFLLFKGDDYYPQGGFDDFVGSYDTVDEAMDAHKPESCQWAHVADSLEWSIVAKSGWVHCGTWVLVNEKIKGRQ